MNQPLTNRNLKQNQRSGQQHGKIRVWNTELVNELRAQIENGNPPIGGSPFYEGDIDFKGADLVYEYTDYELSELVKCANDIVYFANNYAVSMTDEGIRRITLRPYQEDLLRHYQHNRWSVVLASRQIGKTVMTGIFIAWYVLFNIEKNVMVLANKGATAAEIVDKTKSVIKGLPFFMKPGIAQNNVMTMKFDNGCRIMCQSTTKTAAIGFTLHLLFMDEFAHIHGNFIEPFYRSVYPTLSSSQISRVIITSTANGQNKFWEIYSNALKEPGQDGKNEYSAFRVDWWQVPGRDENWKKREIANLGSEELFNQEYGNQFISSDSLLLTSDSLRYLKKIVKKYVWKQIDAFEFSDIKYKDLKWHPDFNLDEIKDTDKFTFTVDLADGVGRDFSVINIFKIEEMSIASMRKLRKDRIEDERSFFRLRQVGMYRSNLTAVEDVAQIAEILFFEVFKTENIKVALEMNFKGDYFVEKLRKNENYYDEIFLHTRHNEKARFFSMGIRLYQHNKMMFCRELRKLVLEKRIIVTEETTYNELSAFGINNKGSYSSQSGYDDVAVTTMYGATFCLSEDFGYVVEDMIDTATDRFKTAVVELSQLNDEKRDDISYVKEFM